VIADTGISAPTKESVGDVRRLWMNDRSRWETVFDKIGEISFTARRAIEAGKPELLGELMNENHALLKTLTVSSPELDKLVEAAQQAGALGAKMSGGGRGGNMIALVESEHAETVSRTLKEAGARNTIRTQIL
jgi:mevalonate kinase